MPGSGVTWQVTTQQETTRPDVSGRFVQGVLIGFTASNGLQGTVFVSDAQYNAGNVKAAIQSKVDSMTEIQNLGG